MLDGAELDGGEPGRVKLDGGADRKPPETGGLGTRALYGASIPERALRGMIGAASGVLKESAEALVPDSMKGMKLYEITVRRMLRTMVEDVGGLKLGECGPGDRPAGADPPDSQTARMAVAQAVDLAGMTTLHLSPLWLLAVVSDVTLGARTYLQALTDELKAQGVIDRGETIRNVDDLLGSLQRLSGSLADKLDAPPITLEELRRSAHEIRAEARRLDLTKAIPGAELERAWKEIQETAAREGFSVFQVSSALGMMALAGLSSAGKGAYGSIKVGYRMIDDNVVRHYLSSLERIREKGFYTALSETYEPYLRGLKRLFDPSTGTVTGDLLSGRLLRRLSCGIRSVLASIWSRLGGRHRREPAAAPGGTCPGPEPERENP